MRDQLCPKCAAVTSGDCGGHAAPLQPFRVSAVMQAVASIAAALEPLTEEERSRAIEAITIVHTGEVRKERLSWALGGLLKESEERK